MPKTRYSQNKSLPKYGIRVAIVLDPLDVWTMKNQTEKQFFEWYSSRHTIIYIIYNYAIYVGWLIYFFSVENLYIGNDAFLPGIPPTTGRHQGCTQLDFSIADSEIRKQKKKNPQLNPQLSALLAGMCQLYRLKT